MAERIIVSKRDYPKCLYREFQLQNVHNEIISGQRGFVGGNFMFNFHDINVKPQKLFFKQQKLIYSPR